MINFEEPNEKVKLQVDKIISDCVGSQFTYKDFEHLICELQEYLTACREKLRSMKMISDCGVKIDIIFSLPDKNPPEVHHLILNTRDEKTNAELKLIVSKKDGSENLYSNSETVNVMLGNYKISRV